MKVIDRILYKLDDLVRPYVHKVKHLFVHTSIYHCNLSVLTYHSVIGLEGPNYVEHVA